VTEQDFEALVREHHAALYRFAVSLCRNETEAADLTQQTFYLWATRGHQLREVAKRKAWLFTTLYREYLGSRRRTDRFPHLEITSVEHELPVVEPVELADLDGAAALRALQAVDEVFRAPLTLFYLEDRSYKDIAEILGIPPGTVMSRLARGKQQLRRILAEHIANPPEPIIRLADHSGEKRAQHD
jgi:RNA polymerase sigma-70 factor (ECF subfamily)